MPNQASMYLSFHNGKSMLGRRQLLPQCTGNILQAVGCAAPQNRGICSDVLVIYVGKLNTREDRRRLASFVVCNWASLTWRSSLGPVYKK